MGPKISRACGCNDSIHSEHDFSENIQKLNGTEYKGQIVNEKKFGKGIILKNNKVMFEGEFKNDFFHGEGKFVFNTGMIYQGNFILGKKSGRGNLYSDDGLYSFSGDWNDDLK